MASAGFEIPQPKIRRRRLLVPIVRCDPSHDYIIRVYYQSIITIRLRLHSFETEAAEWRASYNSTLSCVLYPDTFLPVNSAIYRAIKDLFL